MKSVLFIFKRNYAQDRISSTEGGSGVVGTIHYAWNIDIESCVKSTIVAGPKFTCNVQKSQISTACHYL